MIIRQDGNMRGSQGEKYLEIRKENRRGQRRLGQHDLSENEKKEKRRARQEIYEIDGTKRKIQKMKGKK